MSTSVAAKATCATKIFNPQFTNRKLRHRQRVLKHIDCLWKLKLNIWLQYILYFDPSVVLNLIMIPSSIPLIIANPVVVIAIPFVIVACPVAL